MKHRLQEQDFFLAEHSAIRQPLLRQLLAPLTPSGLADAVSGTLRSSIDFYHGEAEDYATPGGHRLGGLPDLPDAIPWPDVPITEADLLEAEDCWQQDEQGQDVAIFPWDATAGVYRYPMEFIAQLDCRALSDLQPWLPRDGMLFFFLDCGSSVLTSQGKVIYVPETEPLSSGRRFADITFNDVLTLGQKPAYKLHARPSVTSPNFYSIRQNSHLETALAQRLDKVQKTALQEGEYDDMLSELAFPEYYAWELRKLAEFGLIPGSPVSDEALAWLITRGHLPADTPSGTPLPEYSGIARVNGCGFSQHELPELKAARTLGGDAGDYLVLFQVCLDGQFQWGDGVLNFIIHRDDLAARQFERIFIGCDY